MTWNKIGSTKLSFQCCSTRTCNNHQPACQLKSDIPANIGFEEGGCQRSMYTLTDDGKIYAEWTEEFAFEMPNIFDEENRFGDNTVENISKLISNVASRSSNIKEMTNEYKIPANCKPLAPPKVNPEIWSFLQRNVKSRDLLFQGVQRNLGLGMAPVIKMAEFLLGNTVDLA